MLPIKQSISNFNHYTGTNHPLYIVIHDTGNVTDTDEGNANYFDGADRGASAHYFVDDDSITQVVKDTDGAWHIGDGHNMFGINNNNSLGIEMCRVKNTVTETTENNAIELVKFLQNKYNIDNAHVVRHYDASRKICPESYSANNWARWTTFKNKLGSNLIKNIIQGGVNMSNSEVLQVQKLLNRLGFVGTNGQPLVEDGQAGANTNFAITQAKTVLNNILK